MALKLRTDKKAQVAETPKRTRKAVKPVSDTTKKGRRAEPSKKAKKATQAEERGAIASVNGEYTSKLDCFAANLLRKPKISREEMDQIIEKQFPGKNPVSWAKRIRLFADGTLPKRGSLDETQEKKVVQIAKGRLGELGTAE